MEKEISSRPPKSQYIMPYVFEVGPYWEDEHSLQTSYDTLKEAANAAWKFCESENLEMPSPDWWGSIHRMASRIVTILV